MTVDQKIIFTHAERTERLLPNVRTPTGEALALAARYGFEDCPFWPHELVVHGMDGRATKKKCKEELNVYREMLKPYVPLLQKKLDEGSVVAGLQAAYLLRGFKDLIGVSTRWAIHPCYWDKQHGEALEEIKNVLNIVVTTDVFKAQLVAARRRARVSVMIWVHKMQSAEQKKSWNENIRKGHLKPETRMKKSATSRDWLANHPEQREAFLDAARSVWSTPELRARQCEKLREAWTDALVWQRHSEGMKRYWDAHPERKKELSERTKAINEKNPNYRDDLSERFKNMWIRKRDRLVDTMRRLRANPELRAKYAKGGSRCWELHREKMLKSTRDPKNIAARNEGGRNMSSADKRKRADAISAALTFRRGKDPTGSRIATWFHVKMPPSLSAEARQRVLDDAGLHNDRVEKDEEDEYSYWCLASHNKKSRISNQVLKVYKKEGVKFEEMTALGRKSWCSPQERWETRNDPKPKIQRTVNLTTEQRKASGQAISKARLVKSGKEPWPEVPTPVWFKIPPGLDQADRIKILTSIGNDGYHSDAKFDTENPNIIRCMALNEDSRRSRKRVTACMNAHGITKKDRAALGRPWYSTLPKGKKKLQ